MAVDECYDIKNSAYGVKSRSLNTNAQDIVDWINTNFGIQVRVELGGNNLMIFRTSDDANLLDGTTILTAQQRSDLKNQLDTYSVTENNKEIKINLYVQSTMPSLDADGKFALWEDSGDNSLYFIARNNGTTKAVQLS